MSTITGYVPFDYRRVCDGCGNLYNRSKLVKNGPYLLCPDHAGERIAETLDRLNARQRPFRVLPVPNAKPDDERAPDVFEGETSTIFSLLDLTRGAGARYLQVEAGSPTALADASDVPPTNAWACWFYYGLATATYPKGHKDEWHDQALARLRTSADVLLSLQATSGTRATNSFYGGILATGATNYYAEDAAVGGLALLYAYRALGDLKYLVGARNAASFLRNLQAIGSSGVNFTSSDSAGSARLYTGGITSLVSTAVGFFSDHRFFPSSLLALRFWNELKLTDGDQSLGATAAIASEFTTAPSALLTTALSDLRDFWETGTYDVVRLDVRTGLSATTPSEYFNAFPLTKAHTSVTGSGSWEYQDGVAINGTLVSGLNFAKALSSLYSVDGPSAQVTTIDDWLRGFVSNPDYETPVVSSEQSLQHTTTGTYDPTIGIAQYLQVRDPSTLAATKTNGGSLYEWGAFGLLSPMWTMLHNFGFKTGRYQAALRRRRLSDGLPSDGNWDDSGLLRGRQGLTYQTAFRESVSHGSGSEPSPVPLVLTPPTDGLGLWFKSDAGVTKDGSNRVSIWGDQASRHLDALAVDANGVALPAAAWPVFTPNVFGTLPALKWTNALGTNLNHVYPPGTFNQPFADDTPVTVLALVKFLSHDLGTVLTLRMNNDDCEFGMRFRHFGADYNIPLSSAQDAHGYITPFVDYTNVTTVITWTYFGVSASPQAVVSVNGTNIPLIGGPMQAYTGNSGFSIGFCNAVFSQVPDAFFGEVMVYSVTDPGTLTTARNYLLNRGNLLASSIVYDGLTAAQFGASLRQAPRS